MTEAIILSHPYASPTIDIEIATNNVEEDLENKKINIPLPVIKAKQNSTAPITYVVDLKRITHSITVYGYLSSDSTSTALEKKQALISLTALGGSHPEAPNSIGILYKSGDLKLTWRNESIKVTFNTLKIKDTAIRKDKAGSAAEKYELILNLLVGEVR